MKAIGTWARVLWRAFERFNDHDGWAISSHIALSGLMSLFPFLILVISVDTGKVVTLDVDGELGWTPGGNTLQVDAKDDRLTVCDPGTGSCDEIDLPVSGTGKVKLGGLPYES